ncbi:MULTISPECIES: alpha-xenorhabdolysin family binary toxin subunit A [Pseudomonas]|uniref:alpha-xenorhabdolysin family binary toxin subunit A n=1 Tax=Pseudomonas TaxID=286 RepID=UPI0011B05760|nr:MULTISPECIES: alpha-xenorhabdolysin family binary toxin subunit A [Pseudomonas]QXN48495.1 alpha-xenorhabdolysin family binary toxin subunit A [Pseudomonas fluorescens]WSO22805.1 alpha-xenorhabdolysin family binary toxin subunit A [Pseudomonas fluorescens]
MEVKVMEDVGGFNGANHSYAGEQALKVSGGVEGRRLIVTSDQLLQIKLYVQKGKSLSTEREGIEVELGGVIDHPDFHWKEVQELHTKIKAHAGKWLPIESKLLMVGGGLGAFAKTQGTFAADLVQQIEAMPISERVKNYGPIAVDETPFIPFDQLDRAVYEELGGMFQDLKESVNLSRAPTVELKEAIELFHRELSEQLVPSVKLKINKLNTIDFAVDLIRFRESLAEIERDIAQAEKEVRTLAIPSLLKGLNPVAVLLDFILVGPEEALIGRGGVEAIEKLRTFEKKRRSLIAMIDGQEKLPGLILSHSNSLDNIYGFMRAASAAAEALVMVWDSVLAEIEKSASELSLIKEGVSLIRFKQSFIRGIEPWESVKELAESLLHSLNKAIEDFNKQQFAS